VTGEGATFRPASRFDYWQTYWPAAYNTFMLAPIVLINAVGLSPRLLAHAPRLSALAKTGWVADMPEVLPAVTCTAQATLLTGQQPNIHGVVANGWLFHDTNEVRFWQQCNRLIRAEPIYETISGWQGSSAGARSWLDLPAEAIKYVRRVEELIGAPVTLVSTSPERDDTILVQNPFQD